ncbi:MAG: DNA repair protein RecO [Gammaproteobacteria bacterium]|nr:MAG: DNA repair protein RecO [Gammaproteobacteria bacterium]
MRITDQPGYVLHSRRYRETSQILECLTQDHGIIPVIAKGASRPRSEWHGILRPFTRLQITCMGRGDILTLTIAQADGSDFDLAGRDLYCGLYVNELTQRMLHRFDHHPGVFPAYEQVLKGIPDPASQQQSLRYYEKTLLKELGYGLVLGEEAESGTPVRAGLQYRYVVEHGPYPVDAGYGMGVEITGESLLALADNRLSNELQLKECRRLMRYVFEHYLNNRRLKSYDLLQG